MTHFEKIKKAFDDIGRPLEVTKEGYFIHLDFKTKHEGYGESEERALKVCLTFFKDDETFYNDNIFEEDFEC